MATGDKNDLLASLANNITDNQNKENTPARHRTYASQIITYCLNLVEATKQIVQGPVDFSEQIEFTKQPTFLGSKLATESNTVNEAPLNGCMNLRIDGEWKQRASLLASSNTNFTVSGSSATPSFLPVDAELNLVGIDVVNESEGSFKNVSGRTIKTMTGTISFNPDKSGGGTAQLTLISERSLDGITFTGNLNSIRKVEISGSTESFNTKVSFVTDWLDGETLRFRAYETGGGSVDFQTEAETILGQSFTGPSLVWDLSEN